MQYNDRMMLERLVMSRFYYKHTHLTLDLAAAERWVMVKGQAALYNHPIYGIMAYQAYGNGRLTAYEEFSTYNLWQPNGTSIQVPYDDNLFLIKDALKPIIWNKIINEYLQMLTDTRLAVRSNINAMKTPLVLKVQKNEVENAIQAIDNFEHNIAIVESEGPTALDNMRVIDLNVEYKVDALDLHKDSIFREFKETIGFQSIPLQKKSRLLTAESNDGNDISYANLLYAYTNRLQMCEWLKDNGVECELSASSGIFYEGQVPEEPSNEFNKDSELEAMRARGIMMPHNENYLDMRVPSFNIPSVDYNSYSKHSSKISNEIGEVN